MSRSKPSQSAGQHLGEQALQSNSDGYQLLDFGDGRKLELVAGRLLDRPSPAAEGFVRQQPARWSKADSRFETKSKRWTHRSRWNASTMSCGGFQMPVGPTPYGHIGVFPEQAPNWHWLRTQELPAVSSGGEQLRALNLFAYTGASTMALVSAGFAVAHVDAAKPNVQSAREAAAANGWTEPPIRFLVDDAVKFAAREVRRENRYHTIVMDPPAYGHGPSGKAWRLSRDMWPLIDDCLKLLDPTAFRLLITGHSPDVNQHDVQKYLDQNLRRVVSPSGEVRFKVGRLRLPDANGRELDAGFFVRVWNE